eukprot:gene2039-2361_t
MSECLAHSRPLVFVRRDFFNEEPFLRKMLEVHGAAVEMKRRDFLEGHWGPYLLRACSLKVNYNAPSNGAEVVARRLEQVARGQAASGAVQYNPMTHLRDTVVFGYLMATPKNGRVDVPDWYVNGADPNRRLGSYRNLVEVIKATPGAPGIQPLLHDWHLLEGDEKLLQHLPDTLDFLQLLRQLDITASSKAASLAANCSSSSRLTEAAATSAASMTTLEPAAATSSNPSIGDAPTIAVSAGTAARFSASDLPEVRAARGLFRWDDEILVTRAPGRLDVLGGIADYSGSLVLQMPIAEACHVALQLHPLQKQTVWKHIQARHEKLGGPRPALRVVSYHADDTNRAPTFDIDLDDLFEPDGSPIPYESLQRYFKKDPPVSWGAYVAGCLLVLAREKGLKYPEGISILVCSDVPEGKGVSSSAALEVAVMSAVTASLNCQLSGREMALLCQMAENLVVGAPCGVMDQMTSCLGEAGQLLALLCQPAELQGNVPIPPQIRFWGIDSGIRHSVGGSDYASVRIGTFMGLKIISEVSRRQQLMLQSNPSSHLACVLTNVAPPLLGAAVSTTTTWGQLRGGYLPAVGCYLANISPSQFRELFEQELPLDMLGKEFMGLYGPHLDRVTSIEPGVRYAVRNASAHPVHENYRVNCFRALLAALAAAGCLADVEPDAGDASTGGSDEASGAAVTVADGEINCDMRDNTEAHGAQQQQEEEEEEEKKEEPSASRQPNGEQTPTAQGSDGGSHISQCGPQVSHGRASPALLGPLETLGELMFQSHASYTACGLGSDGTNRIVNIVREHMAAAYAAGRPPALYGAKITGGGCGGTVCVMGLAGSAGQAAVDAVVKRYQQETGYSPLVFAGSSIGSHRQQGPDADPVTLGLAAELSSFGYFQRGSVKEMLAFLAKTIVQRTVPGQRQTVKQEDYYCHVHMRDGGIAGVAVTDKDYPTIAAFSVIGKALEEYMEQSKESWRTASGEDAQALSVAEAALVKYQDPVAADKLTKIQKDLDETKVILHQTIDSVLKRGEKLDTLVDKSADLSLASQMFYKQARKTNSCCKMM